MANAVYGVGIDGNRELPVGGQSAVSHVSFDVKAEVRGAQGGHDGPQVAVHPGRDAPVSPAATPPVNNDGSRARQVVTVRLPKGDGTLKEYELSVVRVNADGSLGSLDKQYTYAELQQLARKVEALGLRGDFRSMRIDLNRGDRRHSFTLHQVSYAPHVGNRQDVAYDRFIQGRQAELAALGGVLKQVDNDRRGRQEQLHREGPSNNNAIKHSA